MACSNPQFWEWIFTPIALCSRVWYAALLSIAQLLLLYCNYCTWQTVTTHRHQTNLRVGRGWATEVSDVVGMGVVQEKKRLPFSHIFYFSPTTVKTFRVSHKLGGHNGAEHVPVCLCVRCDMVKWVLWWLVNILASLVYGSYKSLGSTLHGYQQSHFLTLLFSCGDKDDTTVERESWCVCFNKIL